ncbi:hypothetical protein PAPYR_11967 [Paratrimastix pyriformis]|uniref:RNase H type-1 domain-containing protein n=1 Tax=Paratrimastix pyriformis TaxID=342808 RepID=A0ABQ8U7G3_9EUKA|nr:hypothetical protein PAPYR_11967 [Paratrimastix pyriformis]
MHIAEENHLSDFQVHFLKEHAQCGKREVFLEFFNRAEEDDLVFHDLDHISTFKNSMLDEFCKLFGHLGFSSGALPSSTLLKGIIESLQKGCSPAVSRDRIAVWIQKLLSSFMWQCYLKYRDDAPPSHSRHSSASSTDDSSDPPTSPERFPTRTHQRGGDRDVSIPGGFASPLGQEGCAHGGDLHTEVACLPACPGGDAARSPPPCCLGAGPGGMEGDQGAVCAGSPRSNQAGCGQHLIQLSSLILFLSLSIACSGRDRCVLLLSDSEYALGALCRATCLTQSQQEVLRLRDELVSRWPRLLCHHVPSHVDEVAPGCPHLSPVGQLAGRPAGRRGPGAPTDKAGSPTPIQQGLACPQRCPTAPRAQRTPVAGPHPALHARGGQEEEGDDDDDEEEEEEEEEED